MTNDGNFHAATGCAGNGGRLLHERPRHFYDVGIAVERSTSGSGPKLTFSELAKMSASRGKADATAHDPIRTKLEAR